MDQPRRGTRLADAGLGCPDWPGCYGQLTWPTQAEEVQQANQSFPERPVETGLSSHGIVLAMHRQ